MTVPPALLLPRARQTPPQESQTQILKQIFLLSAALRHLLSFHVVIVQTALRQQ